MLSTFQKLTLRFNVTTLSFLLLLFGYKPLWAESVEQTPLRIGIIISSLPWASNDPDKPQGISKEVFEYAFAEMAIPLTVSFQPAARLLAQIHNHQLDGTVVLGGSNPPPSNTLSCTDALITLPFGLYLPASTIPIQKESEDKRLLGMLRLSYMDLRHIPKNLKFKTFNNSDMMFRAFKAGRINGVITTPLIAAHWKWQLQLDLEPKLHFGHLQSYACFSVLTLGDRAKQLATEFHQTFVTAIDKQSPKLPPTTLQVITKFDARNSPKTLLEVE